MAIAASTAPRQKRILSALLLGFLAEIINKICPLITLSLAQKRLGLGSLGSALFSLSILEISIPLIVFGYTYYGAMQLPRMQGQDEESRSRQSRLVSQIILLRLGHALLAAIGLLLASYVFASWHEHRSILLKLIPFLFVAAFDLTFFNFGSQQMGRLSLWVGLFKLVSLAGVMLLVHGPGDADTFAILMLAANGCVSLASAYWILPRISLQKIPWASCWDLLKKASGFAVVVFLYPFFERFDILMAEKILNSEQLGSYTAPWRLVMSLVPLFMVIAHTFLAENLAEKNQEGVVRGAHQALFLSLVLTVPIVAASPFVAADILAMVFDDSLRSSQQLFSIFTASILAEVFVVILGMQILLLRGELRYLSMTLALGILSGSIFAWILQSSYGALGSAWGSLLGRYLTVGLIAWRMPRLLRALPWRDYIAIPISSLLMVALLFALPVPTNLFIRIAAGGFAYLVVLALLQRSKLLAMVQSLRRL